MRLSIYLLMILTLLTGGAATFIWRETLYQRVIEVSQLSGLRLEEITIKGRFNTSETALQHAIATEWYSPMLRLDIERIHRDIIAIGWVRAAIVRRQFPATLEITLIERKALALYQNDDGHLVIDEEGAIINDTKPEAFTHLPVIKGKGAPTKARAVLAMLKTQDGLFADVWSLTYQSQRRWDVYLRNNIRIQLPEIGAEQAWAKLAEMDRKHKLTQRDIVNIDLRVPDKLVIRQAHTKPTQGSNT